MRTLGDRWNRQGPEMRPKNDFPWAGSIAFCDASAVHPVVRAVDFHSRDAEKDTLIENLRSSLEGLRTRKERFGEVRGRLMRGMWRKPQHVLDAKDPLQIPKERLTSDPVHNWALVFNDAGLWGKERHPAVFLVIDAPDVRTYTHKPHKGGTRTEIPGDVSEANRRVLSVCVRENALPPDVVETLRSVSSEAGLPFFALGTAFAGAETQEAEQV